MKLKKIWNKDIRKKDTYVDFKGNFTVSKKGKVTLLLSCDSMFEFYLNGSLLGFGNCTNFPKRKLYYTFDLTKSLKEENELKITVWHMGEDTQTYINDDAYLAFVVKQGKDILLESDSDIESRVNINYHQGHCKKITGQLGYSFFYDFNKDDLSYSKSIEYGEDEFIPNAIKNLKLLKRKNAAVKETDFGYLIDLKKETVGFIDFDIESESKKKITISYGEHLVDGRVPRFIGSRDFSMEFGLKKGRNEYSNHLRRIAGRYLEIDSKDIKINHIGILPVDYPTRNIAKKFDDKLTQKIYDTSVYTLKCCMHEHYEDCPWREQALYTMDSRNQMLCGYYAFRDHEFQRSSLILLANSLRKDGLLAVCAPSGTDIPIPFFSLVYPMQVYEYLEYTKDYSILKEVSFAIKAILSSLSSRVEENGLIKSLPYPYWNFYEWNKESADEEVLEKRENAKFIEKYDLILNAMYVYSYSYFDQIFHVSTDLSKTKNAIKKTFFDENTGLYRLSTACDKPSILGNSLAILIGLGDKNIAEKLKEGKDIVPITLSMNTFFYDALLKIDENNRDWILKSIEEKYTYMLKEDATTFWETEIGWKDFDNAGSLCHGWSAMPVYYYNVLKK